MKTTKGRLNTRKSHLKSGPKYCNNHQNSNNIGHGCIRNPQQYVHHLKQILGNSRTQVRSLCRGARVGVRIQGLNNNDNPETLSKYRNFWAFAAGSDVATEFLRFAKDRRSFAEKALHHVGVKNKNANRYQLVAFDYGRMERAWQKLDGKKHFQATWDNIFNYLGRGFKVCDKYGKCVNGKVRISSAAKNIMKANSYHQLTKGTPEAAWETKHFLKILDDNSIPYDGSVSCVQKYETLKPSWVKKNRQGRQEAVWARVWLEKCMAASDLFTGNGRGRNAVTGRTTGTEFIVRGDLSFGILDAHTVDI